MSYAFLRFQGESAHSPRKLPFLLAALCLLTVLAGEEWLSIRHLSITVDEGAHTYAGYEHWRKRDFGVNPEHPPLVKLVAAAPLLGLHLQQPHPPPINFMVEQYLGGSQLYTANDGEQILTRARRAASLFTLLLALLVFAASYEIFGGPVALIALFSSPSSPPCSPTEPSSPPTWASPAFSSPPSTRSIAFLSSPAHCACCSADSRSVWHWPQRSAACSPCPSWSCLR